MDGFIGLFWLIDDNIKYKRFPLAEEIAKQSGSSYITPPVSQERSCYPQGYVNYNAKSGKFEIDMDACLHNDNMILFALNLIFMNDKPTRVLP
jgi:hypothetical protein